MTNFFWAGYMLTIFFLGAVSGIYAASEIYLLRNGLLRRGMLISRLAFALFCIIVIIQFNGHVPSNRFWASIVLLLIIIGQFIEATQLSYNRRKAHRYREKKYIDTPGHIEATIELTTGLLSSFEGDAYGVFGGYTYGDIVTKYSNNASKFIENIIFDSDKKHFDEAWDQITNGDFVARILEYQIYGKDQQVHWVQQAMVAVKDTYGHIVAIDTVCESITSLKDIQEELKESNARLSSLLEISQLNVSYDELTDFALEECVKLTHSKIGYFHLVKKDQVIIHQWSQSVKKECTITPEEDLPLDLCGIWADSLRQKKPIIHNDYKALKKDYLPEGHIALTRHMGIPILDKGLVVAIVGVGNKSLPYTQKDQDQLELYLEELWVILNKKEIEIAWTKRRKLVQAVVDNCPNDLWAQDVDGRYLLINKIGINTILHSTLDNVLGKTDREIIEQRFSAISIEDQEIWKQTIGRWEATDQQALNMGTYHAEEIFPIDNTLAICEVKKSAFYDNNELIGIVGWLSNKTVEHETQHRKNILSKTINHINLGIILYNDYHEIVFANHYQGMQYQQPCHTLIGKNLKVFYPNAFIVPETTDDLCNKTCLVQNTLGEIRPVHLSYLKFESTLGGHITVRIEELVTKRIFHELFGHYKITKNNEFAIILIQDTPIYINEELTRLTGYTLETLDLSFLNIDLEEIEDDTLFLSEITTTTGIKKNQLWRAFDSLQGLLLLGTDLE